MIGKHKKKPIYKNITTGSYFINVGTRNVNLIKISEVIKDLRKNCLRTYAANFEVNKYVIISLTLSDRPCK